MTLAQIAVLRAISHGVEREKPPRRKNAKKNRIVR
jgi:hypothetical protein